jgi:hypothetical protein
MMTLLAFDVLVAVRLGRVASRVASAVSTRMTKRELRAAADLLRALLARVGAGEVTASARVVARLEGVLDVLDVLARSKRRGV